MGYQHESELTKDAIGQVSWSLEGEGATLATDYETPTSATLTATGLGEGTVTVEYSFGGKTVSDEMTYDVNFSKPFDK